MGACNSHRYRGLGKQMELVQDLSYVSSYELVELLKHLSILF